MAGRTNGGDPTGLQFSLGSVSAFALKVAPETLARAIYELERSEWLVSHHVLAYHPARLILGGTEPIGVPKFSSLRRAR